MNEVLEAVKRLKWGYAITQEEHINLCECIEQELKQAQKDKEMLDIFKNALTVKHTFVLPKEQKSLDDTFSYAFRYLYEITQSNLDEKLRKSLREWVLKNAFPKELKELEERREMMKRFNEACIPMILDNETEKKLKTLEIIKELFDFDFALRFPNNQPMLRITNKRTNEYWELPILKETQDLLKEVLL